MGPETGYSNGVEALPPVGGFSVPRPVPVPVRRAAFRRWRRGQSAAAIAEALDLHPRTVARLLRRFAAVGERGVSPGHDHCGPRSPATPADLVDDALRLRREHPTWGAGLIRVMLRRLHPGRDLPAARSVQRWLRQAGLAPARSGRPRGAPPLRAGRPHAVWQVDAREQIPLSGGDKVCWLRIVDECSGAALQTAVFPPGAPVGRSPAGGTGAAAAGLRPLGPAAAAAGG
jgi:Homeodomain-like domain-containing protein